MTAHIQQITGTVEYVKWDEEVLHAYVGESKLACAKVINQFKGDIQGESNAIGLLFYVDSTNGTFTTLEHVTGTLGGRLGSFVIQHNGTFAGSDIKADWLIVPGSGTNELQGLSGKGHFIALHNQPSPFTLDYSFD